MTRSLPSIVLITLLLSGGPVFAQEASPSTETRATPSESATDTKKATDGEKREQHQFLLGPGLGLVFWPPTGGGSGGDVAPAIALQTRSVHLAPRRLAGWEWTNDIVFHDFQAMADGYDWYFREPSEDDKISPGVKKGLLWPGLILIPFGGANYTTGAGFIIYTASQAPAAFFDIGAQFNLFLRLSDPDFKADVSIGAYGGGGYEFNDFLSVSGRLSWGSPLIHNIRNNTAVSIWTTIVNVNFSF